jgi:hypothetical protein
VDTHDDDDFEISTENLDHLFTPEVIRDLRRISAAVNAGGKTFSEKEVKEHFRKKSESWLKDHGKS